MTEMNALSCGSRCLIVASALRATSAQRMRPAACAWSISAIDNSPGSGADAGEASAGGIGKARAHARMVLIWWLTAMVVLPIPARRDRSGWMQRRLIMSAAARGVQVDSSKQRLRRLRASP
ncbi:hypothetical protein [Achromobacter xylosoxidans]|uniref:hypothetical protein n=1 Tax=Alcaligenes xylosoxydans xylosoxydans TaxID=85698 RepID=UPI001F13715C|nr:hypothetical protein [Achromobacter xylosoxidans]